VHLATPRLAEIVADRLRTRIFSGEMEDGSMLPKQEDLLDEFQVGLVTIRESMRILETEGLITVQRGNQGGAVVHRPKPWKIAYMVALSLQSQSVQLSDLLTTLRLMEPLCAAACANRPDRATSVVPILEEIIERSRARIDDAEAYVDLAVEFHIALVAHCGITTMSLIVGALEFVWSAHLEKLVQRPARHGPFAEKKIRLTTLREHETMCRLIAEGDAAGAERVAREHLSEAHHEPNDWHHAFDYRLGIDASFMRDAGAKRPRGLSTAPKRGKTIVG
jgi:DNA-binding FadR family transcriptional regulator